MAFTGGDTSHRNLHERMTLDHYGSSGYKRLKLSTMKREFLPMNGAKSSTLTNNADDDDDDTGDDDARFVARCVLSQHEARGTRHE